MPKPARLKVYRTPIGFHDAYVAAPSQKAALAAWGSEHDLFGRGVAELVTEPELSAEPLAHPGRVIKRLRGTTAEQIAALPADRPSPSPKQAATKAPPQRARPAPKPDRSALDQAERALADAEAHQAEAERALAARERDLARERKMLAGRHAAERRTLARRRDAARAAYDEAIKAWRG